MTISDWAWATMLAAVLMFLSFVAGYASHGDGISTDGHNGQVYVADTHQWVDAGDHSAHEAGQ